MNKKERRTFWFWAWLAMLLAWSAAQVQPLVPQAPLIGPPLSGPVEAALFDWLAWLLAGLSLLLAIIATGKEST
jgi:hypothetical protein